MRASEDLATRMLEQPRGRRAAAAARPRRTSGVLRTRLPLRRMLLHAELEGRLVRYGGAFAVLDLPGEAHDEFPRPDVRARRLDRLDRWWDVLVFAVPPAVLLAAAAVTALAVPRTPAAALPALALVAAGMLWVAALMTASVAVQLYAAWNATERIRDPAAHAAGPFLGRYWSVLLLDSPDPADVPELLRAARRRAADLGGRLPDRYRGKAGVDALLVRLDGCTSDEAEVAALTADDALPLPGTTPRLMLFGDRTVTAVREQRNNPPRGITLLLLAAPLVVLLSAPMVAARERGTCVTAGVCPTGGLTSYGRAVTWLLDQLFLRGDEPGLSPARFDTRVLGYALNVLGVTLLVCVVVAVARYLSFQRQGVVDLDRLIQDSLDAKQPTVAIVTALPEEAAAVRALLDGGTRYQPPGDPSAYVLGSVPAADGGDARHRVVLARTVEGGTNRAANTVANLTRSFPSINSVIMCGIAAGVPRPDLPGAHVRLGDIVVGSWAIVDFDHVDELLLGSRHRGGMASPSTRLKQAVFDLRTREIAGDRPWERWLDASGNRMPSGYARPPDGTDVLWDDATGREVAHPDPRSSGHRPGLPSVHHGRIGSADRSLRNSVVRDRLAAAYDVIAFEMEGSGVGTAAEANEVDWLVVRGISDYGDSRTDGTWRFYAALAAAAYVRALLAESSVREGHGGHSRGA